MQWHSLARKHPSYKPAPVGRGGKRGKTSGRGGKGQTARAGRKMRPEMRDTIKKIPKRRGWGKNRSRTIRSRRTDAVPVNLGALETAFVEGALVTPAALLKKGLVRAQGGRSPRVKILGGGTLSKALRIQGCTISASARAALLKTGGSIS